MSRAAKLFGLCFNNKNSSDDDDLEKDARHQRASTSPEKLNQYLKSLYHNNASTGHSRNFIMENEKTAGNEDDAAGNKTPENINLEPISQELQTSDDNFQELINLEPSTIVIQEDLETFDDAVGTGYGGGSDFVLSNNTIELVDAVGENTSTIPNTNNELVVIEIQSNLHNSTNENIIIGDFSFDPENCVNGIEEVIEVGTAPSTEDTNIEESFGESNLDNSTNETMIIDDFSFDPKNCVNGIVEVTEVGTASSTEDTNIEESFGESNLDNSTNETMIIDDFSFDPKNCVNGIVEVTEVGTASSTEDTNIEESFGESNLDNSTNETMIIGDFSFDPKNCVNGIVEVTEVGTAPSTEDTNIEESFGEESPYPNEDLIHHQECNNAENYPFEVPRKRKRATDSSSIEGNESGTGRERNLRGHKRVVVGDTRISRLKRTELRNKGQSYTTKSGKNIKARNSVPLRMCRLKCKEKVSQKLQKSLFDDYWSLGTSSKRAGFIASLIEISEPVKSRPRSDNPQHFRQITVHYHLIIDGRNVRVCKKCFCQCFGEGNKFLETVIAKKKATESGIIQEDMRGRNIPRNKTSEKQLKEARDHLLSLPSYESHYTRKDSSKRYLPPYYTISQCYEEYKNKYKENLVSEKIYRQLFHELKLSIKIPNKDTCQTCDKLHMDIKLCKNLQDREMIQKQLDAHHELAENAYASKALDRSQSKEDPSKKTITFDLQQCLPTPLLQSSLCFYKRQLWVFNLSVHDCDNGQAYCYMWDETRAARGGNDIASCIYKYLIELPPTVTHVTMYSDTCGGQNKNIYFAIMCMVALQNSKSLETIDHKFLIPGHTRMESDSDHSLIEKMKRKSKLPIEHPHDWIQLVRLAGKKKPFIVNEMEQKDFYSFADILKNQLQNRKIDTNKNKVNWRQMKWLRFSSNEIGSFQFKNSLEHEELFKKVDLRRRGKTQHNQLPLREKYSSQLAITAEKKKDLLDLLPFISETFREFYKNIPTNNSARNSIFIDSENEEGGD